MIDAKTIPTGPVSEITVTSRVTEGVDRVKTLARLESMEIPWHVTAEGDLMMTRWEIVQPGFITMEEAAVIRASRPAPPGADDYDWYLQNLEELEARFGGQWIAIADRQVRAYALSLPELIEILDYQGTVHPLIQHILSEPEPENIAFRAE